ncbi:bifunctional phosphoribosylaminoimidazolecarboxamide formyltransferase/IMP cyclohydrolase [Bartonella sp. DGB1]|uniref:bifunctional phosphoribosylaminoimidazolecarboxamide formyltransferase/IMP cyclohydrolase n=1 Tax=Bartonella sp. DGB1 TaxID=3239807 RepID=UPI003526061E
MDITADLTSNEDLIAIKRALISVSDKSNLLSLANFLVSMNVELISTGGSAKYLQENGFTVTNVADITNFPEIMDGRVKTLHPLIHGGLLAKRNDPQHTLACNKHKIKPIDLLIVNLYPFIETVNNTSDNNIIIENIDIGGPAMIRAAAKNYHYVSVLTNPNQYENFKNHLLENNGASTLQQRYQLAAAAFIHTSHYDTNIANWFNESSEKKAEDNSTIFPNNISINGSLSKIMRYGENPHQKAALYVTNPNINSVVNASLIQGKELSYNNINDSDAAFELICDLPKDKAAVAIIKHANPCGVAIDKDLSVAYEKALACDPVSAFGGIIALNKTLDGSTAEKITKIFTEVIIAPDADKEAMNFIAQKKQLRLLLTKGLPNKNYEQLSIKSVMGGLLVQEQDDSLFNESNFKIVTKRQPTEQELKDLKFAFTVAKHVKSNAIVYAKNQMTIGIGAGQMNRRDSSRIAVLRAKDLENGISLLKNSVVASDAFFPFSDGLLAAIEAGASAAIQPGGSIRDEEVIKTANEHNIAMIFTGIRHFKH